MLIILTDLKLREMRKLFVTLLVFAMSLSTFANIDRPTEKVNAELRTRIVKLLGEADFKVNKELKASVVFMVNKKGEIIVLSVNSQEKSLDKYIKSKLNYRLAGEKYALRGKIYKMPIKIVKK